MDPENNPIPQQEETPSPEAQNQTQAPVQQQTNVVQPEVNNVTEQPLLQTQQPVNQPEQPSPQSQQPSDQPQQPIFKPISEGAKVAVSVCLFLIASIIIFSLYMCNGGPGSGNFAIVFGALGIPAIILLFVIAIVALIVDGIRKK